MDENRRGASAIAEAVRGRELEGMELLLGCRACGARGRYRVGAVVVDPARFAIEGDGAVGFTGIFGCRKCDAEGPWRLPLESSLRIGAKLLGRHDDLVRALVLSDGTRVGSGAEAVRHLLGRLEAEPRNALLWNRLGNAYETGGIFDEAVRAWERAIEIDPEEIESHFSLGSAAFEAGAYLEAMPHLHTVLKLARRKESVPIGLRRAMVKDALGHLLSIREEMGSDAVRLGDLHLSREEEWDRFADMVIGAFRDAERSRRRAW